VKHPAKSGFTLIELLVALAILGVIVVMCGVIFEQSNLSWSTGSRKAEVNMVGRGVADFISQDIGRCIARTPADFSLVGSTLTFKIIDENVVVEGSSDTYIYKQITYDFSAMTRSVKDTPGSMLLAPKDMVKSIIITPQMVVAGELPGYVDVTVEVQDTDETYQQYFKSRAWLVNRDRYKYDE
jgi:prepilin-type N-terminal cleavage/methylation domain-containing protein